MPSPSPQQGMRLSRRTYLGTLGSGFLAGLAGCSDGINSETLDPAEKDGSGGNTTTETDPEVTPSTDHAVTQVPVCGAGGAYWVDVTPVDQPGPEPLKYAELPPREQAIVRTAVGPTKWASCPDDEQPFFAFRDRVMERRRTIDGETVYLQYRGSPYCLTVWAADLMISACPPPD